MIMIEIQYALLLQVNPHHKPQLYLKRRHFVASYVLPVMQQYKSTTVEKNFCNQNIKLGTTFIKNRNHHVPTTKLTLFMVSKDEWDTK